MIKQTKKLVSKIIVGLLSAIIVGTAFSSVSLLSSSSRYAVMTDEVEAATTTFSDVTDAKAWYYKPVYWAAERGITTGSNGKFYPDAYCKREEIATFLWRAMGKAAPKSMESKFSDVTDSRRYSYKAIMWAAENGIITGTDGKFSPLGTCTREAAVTMIWRVAGRPTPKSLISPFKDVTQKTSYSYKAIMWAAENGITTGTNGYFTPKGKCKRRDIVTFIYRYFNKFKNSEWKTENGKKYYYQDGKLLKGLQKIDDTWYLLDKNTGEYTGQSGKKLYIGSFFGSDNGTEKVADYPKYITKSYKYFTLDGVNFNALSNADYTYNSFWPTEKDASTYKSIFTKNGRDSSVYMKDGMFYTALTAPGTTSATDSSGKEKTYVRDFTILNTADFITYNWGGPNTHYPYWNLKETNGDDFRRASPEWFVDDSSGNLYVFYVGQYAQNDKKALYITQCKENMNFGAHTKLYNFTEPIRLTLNGAPANDKTEIEKGAPATKPIDSVIDPTVIKVGNDYYLMTKREAWKSGSTTIKNLQATLMMYKASDSSLTKWNYLYEFDNYKLPYNQGKSYDYYTAEGPCLKYVNGKYYLYMDVFNTVGTYNFYEGIHYFTTTDITKRDSWKYGGKIVADNKFGYANLRHGSVNEVTDDASANVIKTIYNGIVEVPKVSLKYNGKEQSFVKYFETFWGKPVGSAYYEVKDGTWKATEKGEYSVTIELKSSALKWSDGGSKRRTVKWSIV